MAEEDSEQENDGGKSRTKGRLSPKKKLILLILVGLLVVAGSVGGTLALLGVFKGSGDAAGEPAPQQAAPGGQQPVASKPKPAMYFPIKPAFIVNFPDRGTERYLQADITIMTRDPDIFAAMQTHLPLIKNRIVLLLGAQAYRDLQTDEGKELLRQKLLKAINDIMQRELGKTGVEQVLFTNFVMQ